MFNENSDTNTHDNDTSDIKLYQTPYFSRNGAGKQIYVLLMP